MTIIAETASTTTTPKGFGPVKYLSEKRTCTTTFGDLGPAKSNNEWVQLPTTPDIYENVYHYRRRVPLRPSSTTRCTTTVAEDRQVYNYRRR